MEEEKEPDFAGELWRGQGPGRFFDIPRQARGTRRGAPGLRGGADARKELSAGAGPRGGNSRIYPEYAAICRFFGRRLTAETRRRGGWGGKIGGGLPTRRYASWAATHGTLTHPDTDKLKLGLQTGSRSQGSAGASPYLIRGNPNQQVS